MYSLGCSGSRVQGLGSRVSGSDVGPRVWGQGSRSPRVQGQGLGSRPGLQGRQPRSRRSRVQEGLWTVGCHVTVDNLGSRASSDKRAET
eukprot:775422-Rhodomonas_salina.1